MDELLENVREAISGVLEVMKEQGKRSVKGNPPYDERLAGIVRYFVAVAAALVQHETLISTHDREEIAEILGDLAAVVPRPWIGLMTEAVAAL